ncbi:MAG TPA: DUF3006 domain-containing protein [Methanocella sp.]|nr:DUF3006 domain-containing protein [Methanocella sp.]
MKAAIDRFEEGLAVLVFRGSVPAIINLPVQLLPEGCQEGDILDIRISRDFEGTEAARKRVSGLIEKLKHKEYD